MTTEVTYVYSYSCNRLDHSMFFIQDSLFRFFVYSAWYDVEYVA